MRNIILSFLFAFTVSAQIGPPPASPAEIATGTDTYKYISPYGLANSGVGGAAVSNSVNQTFVLNTRYTNDTDHYVEVGIGLQYSIAAANSCSATFAVDTNVTSGTYDYSRLHIFSGVAVAGTFRDTTLEMVPPRAAFRITDTSAGSSTVTIVSSEGSLMYFSTNSGAGGGGDVTQAGLAAGSYDINTVIYGTNILFGRDSALLSRGKHLPSRAYDYLPGLGSIDFQSPNEGVTTNRMAYVESLYSSILGGIGNRITNAVLDFPGSNSVINGGYLNIIENGASCIIGNGEQNYIGAVDTSSPEGESQSSFIGGGKNNAILDGHESAIVGGNNNTNNSSEGFIGAGLRNIMESTQGFIGAGNRNKTYSSEGAFIGAGAHNFITNSFYASILGVSNIVTFSNSVTLGVNLTNANYTLMAGVGTNFFSVSPNGGVTMRGSGGDTNLLRFTSATLSRSVDTFYTNIDRRAFIQIRISTTSVGIGGEIADVRLEIDQDGNGSWEETENRFVEADPGAALATQVVLSDYLQPNARYRVVTTNSTGFCGGFVEGVRIKYF